MGLFPGIENKEEDFSNLELAYCLIYECSLILTTIFSITATVLFFVWLYRMSKNARHLGAVNLEFSPGWTVGWFFIPIACLFKPYYAVKELWSSFDPCCADGISWKGETAPGLIGYWWAFWIVSSWLSRVALKLTLKAETPAMAQSLPYIDSVSYLVDAVSFIITILLIRELMKRLSRRATAVNERITGASLKAGEPPTDLQPDVKLPD